MLGTCLMVAVGVPAKLTSPSGVVPGWASAVVETLACLVIRASVLSTLSSARERGAGLAGRVRNTPVEDAAVVARWRPHALDWLLPTAVVAGIVLTQHWY